MPNQVMEEHATMKQTSPRPEAFPVSITGIGVFAATGDLAAALWGGIATRLSASRVVPGLSVPDGGSSMAQPYYAPITALPTEMETELRITIMAAKALAQACTALPKSRPGLRLLVMTLLPASSPERPDIGSLDREELSAHFRELHPALGQAEVRFAEEDAGATFHLNQCLEELRRGPWDAILFGGADSLIDRETIQAFVARKSCCTDRHPEGTLLSEGAAYLLLEKHSERHRARGIITGLGHAREPNHRQGDLKPMTALTASIEQALAQCPPSQVETIVLPMENDIPTALEWHQVEGKLWRKPGPDADIDIEELNPQSTIGYTGAAALPLALATGCARFAFNFPPAERILVCEIGRGQSRGAVFLKSP